MGEKVIIWSVAVLLGVPALAVALYVVLCLVAVVMAVAQALVN